MKQKGLVYVGWAVSVLFLFLALRGVDWRTVFQVLARVPVWVPFLMIGVYLCSFLLRTWRWQCLLDQPIPTVTALKATILGFAANNVLPARLGELVRAHAIARKSNLSTSRAFASVIVEKIFDGFIIIGLLFVGTYGESVPAWATSTGYLGSFVFGGGLLVTLVLAITQRRWVPRLSIVPNKFRMILLNFNQGLTLVWRSPVLPLKVLALSLGIWLIESGVFAIASQSLSFQIPLKSAFFVMGIVNLGILVPSSPGYIGTFQYFGTLALGAWGVSPAAALAGMVLIHLCQYLPITLLGFSLIPQFGVSSLEQITHSTD